MSRLSKQSPLLGCKRKYTTSTNSNDGSPPKQRSLRQSTTTPSYLDRLSRTVRTSLAPTTPTPDTVGLDFNFDSTYKELRELTETNCKYFAEQSSDVCRRFERLLTQLLQSLDATTPHIQFLTDNFHHFDYSPEIRANGYRTLAVTHGQACLRTLTILQQVDAKRVGFLFNLMYSSRLFQELESWTKALMAMQRIVGLAVKMVDYSKRTVLYVSNRE